MQLVREEKNERPVRVYELRIEILCRGFCPRKTRCRARRTLAFVLYCKVRYFTIKCWVQKRASRGAQISALAPRAHLDVRYPPSSLQPPSNVRWMRPSAPPHSWLPHLGRSAPQLLGQRLRTCDHFPHGRGRRKYRQDRRHDGQHRRHGRQPRVS